MAKHYVTEHRTYSLCEETGTDDVFSYGTDTGPADYCTACRAAEPEWITVEDDEFFELEKRIF